MTNKFLNFLLLICFAFLACNDNDDKNNPENEFKLIFKFQLDSTQVRLNNLGQAVSIPQGRAGQSPRFNGISAHYIEMAPTDFTQIGEGAVLFHQEETQQGGARAILHSAASIKKDGEVFFEIPLRQVPVGVYKWLRVSLAYQNYDITMHIDTNISGFPINQNFDATIASFVGFNTFINSFKIKTTDIQVNQNKKQGFWAFETQAFSQFFVDTGSALVTTVPNPIFATSPMPEGSCLVTGKFENQLLNITGNETKDITILVSLSVNQSFEWQDNNSNGLFEPLKGEKVVDMGLRGLIPIVQ